MTKKSITLFAFAAIGAFALSMLPTVHAQEKSAWTSLFNGKDLSGWDTWLGIPVGEKERVGLNKDPNKVFTIVNQDGKPAIRISGEIYGALTSKKSYGNYHFKLQTKWGKKKWPPRLNARRDSGLLYHCVGPHGVTGRGAWMRSQECQIQEQDCGDFWSVAGGIVTVTGIRKGRTIFYKKGGDKFTVPSKGIGNRIVRKAGTYEKKGQWNTIELYTVGQTSVHVVNGEVLMVLTGSSQKVKGKTVPLTRGKLQIQSEGAEVFYRDIAIRSIERIPEKLLQ